MSTSIAYHEFGLRGPYDYVRVERSKGISTIVLAHKPFIKCPKCRSQEVIKKGCKTRRFRMQPVGKRQMFVSINNQRIRRKSCNFLGYLPLSFVSQKKARYTKMFEQYVLTLLKESMTMLSVARLLKISWNTVKDIYKRRLKKRFMRPSLKAVTHIGIDEIYCGKKMGFLTVVIDLKTSAVIYTERGKKASSLDNFWKMKKKSKTKIVAIATDMGAAYISSAKSHAPDATLVIDRFHVVKLMNDKLSTLRRRLQNACGEKDKHLLKNTRWLLVGNRENLDESAQERLAKALEMNEPLTMMYMMKERLRLLWTQKTKGVAIQWLECWIEEAIASGLKELKTMAKTLEKHKEGILAYYDERISSGKVEGVNNRIKTMIKSAYGYRDREFLELKIKASHMPRY